VSLSFRLKPREAEEVRELEGKNDEKNMQKKEQNNERSRRKGNT
jgi:hypothetical protein